MTLREQLCSGVEFDIPIMPVLEHRGDCSPYRGGHPWHHIEGRRTPLEIDRAPVVGIDEVEIPEFASLIDVRDARDGELKHCLSQRVDHPRQCNARCESLKIRQE